MTSLMSCPADHPLGSGARLFWKAPRQPRGQSQSPESDPRTEDGCQDQHGNEAGAAIDENKQEERQHREERRAPRLWAVLVKS